LKELLVRLLELQSIDAKVKELEASIKSLPTRTEPARRDLAKLDAMVAADKQRLTETEQWKKQQELLLEREQDGYRSAKAKLQASKNGKEYNAASREVDNRKKGIQDREAELKKLNETLGLTQTQVAARDKDIDDVRRHLAEDEAGVAAKVAALQAEAAEAASGRAALRAQIEPSWLKIYDSLAAKKGYAVAPVVKGTCRGCHMLLPPQLANILARMQSLEVCPRCGRIVYREELLAPPAPGDGEGGGEAPAT
jgi:predicted  nucleic acid-binding Zn-ribbon protein